MVVHRDMIYSNPEYFKHAPSLTTEPWSIYLDYSQTWLEKAISAPSKSNRLYDSAAKNLGG